MANSTFSGNGLAALDHDGFRVNEGGMGHIVATVTGSTFTGNGAYDVVTDPDDGIDVDEAGLGHRSGAFRDVYVSSNPEQGVDLNENDAGDLRVDMTRVEASDNPEEGIEFEEDDDSAGGGDLVARLTQVTTLRNGTADGDAGLKLREKGDGTLDARVVNAVSSNNCAGGILFREDANGQMQAILIIKPSPARRVACEGDQ